MIAVIAVGWNAPGPELVRWCEDVLIGEEPEVQGLLSNQRSKLIINGRNYRSIDCTTVGNDVVCKIRR